VEAYPVIDHGGSRLGRWLRARRFRLAFLIAVVETLLILPPFEVIGWYTAVLLAALVIAFYVFVGRRARFQAVREVSWAGAVAQFVPVIVPFVALAVAALAVAAVVVVLGVVLVVLLINRK
jgi:hypothetical protein